MELFFTVHVRRFHLMNIACSLPVLVCVVTKKIEFEIKVFGSSLYFLVTTGFLILENFPCGSKFSHACYAHQWAR